MRMSVKIAALIAAAGLFVGVGLASAWDQSGAPKQQGSSPGGQSQQQSMTGMNMSDPQMVKSVQEKLNNEGYAAGPANGTWSDKSQQAMTQFQKDNNLEPTGQINQESLAQLGLAPAGSAGAGGQQSTPSEQPGSTSTQQGGMSDQQGGTGGQANPQQGGSSY